MNLWESVRIAVRALAANKLRALLTMLGLIIGVGAVIAMVAVGRGAQISILQQIQSLGTNILFVRPGSTQSGGVRGAQGSAATLTLQDAAAILQAVRSVQAVAPELGSSGQLVAGNQNWNTRIVATNPSYPAVRNWRPAAGQFFTAEQYEQRRAVMVLGATVARNLFPGGSPLGQAVRLSVSGSTGVIFTVIGVMESKGGTGFGSPDDQVFVPLTTYIARVAANRNVQGAQTVSTINVSVADEAEMARAVAEIGALLRQRHRVVQDDFSIQSQEDFLRTVSQVSGSMTLLLGAIAGISLVVGGIGIMNIMLVSVTERTREIGIRKAVGARRRDILVQFLIEALVVSSCGGLLGIGAGLVAARFVGAVAVLPGPPGTRDAQAVVTPDAVLLAFGVSVAVGLFFGTYPALRAAQLRPIQALRYE
ncbi:MAG TPA: ABC transporter permease [Chloroflexota bacterium]|nr:ABC transporter permease [Chloroflexota bacterium]